MTTTLDAAPTFTTTQIRAALRTRYPAPEYALLEEVRNGTGYSGVTRSADAISFGLWPSRGMEIAGFEIKASRSDWQRELKDPAKAEEISRFCDRWWVVAGSEKIVHPGELPPTWGLLVPARARKDAKGPTLRVAVEAPVLPAETPTRKLLAAIFRNEAERRAQHVHRDDIADVITKARTEAKAHAEERLGHELEGTRSKLTALEKQVIEFAQHSGIDIADRGGSTKDLGKLVALLRAGQVEARRVQLAELLTRSRTITETLTRELGDLDSPETRSALEALHLSWREQSLLGVKA